MITSQGYKSIKNTHLEEEAMEQCSAVTESVTGAPDVFKQQQWLTGDAELLGTKRSFPESSL